MTTVIQTKFLPVGVRRNVIATVQKRGYTAPSNYPQVPPENMNVVLESYNGGQHTYRYAAWVSQFDLVFTAEQFLGAKS